MARAPLPGCLFHLSVKKGVKYASKSARKGVKFTLKKAGKGVNAEAHLPPYNFYIL